jgi:hypothetical protein
MQHAASAVVRAASFGFTRRRCLEISTPAQFAWKKERSHRERQMQATMASSSEHSVRRFCVMLVLLGLASLATAPIDAQTTSASSPREVQTLAGSGRAGIDDGPAARATFLLPVGIAVGADGSIYVADRAAQRIRSIKDGVVTTVAGSGPLERLGLSVHGGYRDGPAAQAQFNLPSGIAIGPDGAVYIADSANACIRKLDHGVVSTVVGKPGESKLVDGDAATARLVEPRALAFDAAGAMYIADFEGGLRRLGRDGHLSTIDIKRTPNRQFLGVAVDRADGDGTILVSTPNFIIYYNPRDGSDGFTQFPVEEGHPIGHAAALAALDHREFLFTDMQSSSLRYFRIGALPYSHSFYGEVFAGPGLERPSDNAGFRDGTRQEARFYSPAGIDVSGPFAFIADTGNRRIRRVALPRFLKPEAGPEDWLPVDKNHYEIVYMGSSSAFYDNLGDDSICGQIEANLDRSHRFPNPVRCHPVRTDGSTTTSMHDYIENFIAPRGFNLVIMQMSISEVLEIDPKEQNTERIKELFSFRQKMDQIVTLLKQSHTKLAVAWMYAGVNVSLSESFAYRETDWRLRRVLPPELEQAVHASIAPFKPVLDSLHVPQYDPYDDYIAYERSANALPLFGTGEDTHPNPRGNAFAGKIISAFLLSLPADALQ